MNKLSDKTSKFVYLGKDMPIEFEEVCKEPKYEWYIKNRIDKVFKFSEKFEYYLKRHGMSSLYSYADLYGYDKSIKMLFYPNISEDAYKNIYKEAYDSFFNDLLYEEKKKTFVSADYGAKTILQHKKDTTASNIFENIICTRSHGFLVPNDDATGRCDSGISTKCDLRFVIKPGVYKFKPEGLDIPIEVKSKWSDTKKEISMRGSSYQVKKAGGLILVIYMNIDKFAVVDPLDSNNPITKGIMKNSIKSCDNIEFPNVELYDFKLGDEECIKKILRVIVDTYKKRGQ